MTAERWKRVEEIFHGAIERRDEDRRLYLERECANDAPLRREVEVLLGRYETSDGLLEASIGPVAAALLESGLAPRSMVGRYEILRKVGAGGMGSVYAARDTQLGRTVALKLLPGAWSRDAERLARFRREAMAGSSLNHPNIAAVYDVGEHEGRAYLVSEFVEGRALRERVAEGALQAPEAIGIVAAVSSALSAAHEAGIVHRDIKPENIMIRPDGTVKLVDFGLAKFVVEPPVLPRANAETRTGLVLGTLDYMSPEQLRGERVDARTDIWSVGVVLYELVSARRPFGRSTPSQVMAAILEDAPPPLEGMPDLDSVVRRCLEKKPARRPESALRLVTELNGLLAGRPRVGSALAGRARRAAACAAVLAGAAVVWLGSRDAATPSRHGNVPRRDPSRTISLLTSSGRVGRAAVSPDGRFVAYSLLDPGAESLWVRQVATEADVELRSPSRDRYGGISFSNDGAFVFYSAYGEGNRSTLWRIPVVGGDARPVVGNVDSPVSFSPDGSRVAFMRANLKETQLITATTDGSGGEKVLTARGDPDRLWLAGPAWSPDGRSIAYAESVSERGRSVVTIAILDLQRAAAERLKHRWQTVHRLAWLRDGSGLVASAADETEWRRLVKVFVPSGRVENITDDSGQYLDVTVTSDGSAAFAVCDQSQTYLCLAGAESRRLTHDTAFYDGVAWDAEDLLTVIGVGPRSDIWRVQPSTGKRVRLTDDAFRERDVRPCAAGRYVVFSSNRTGSWNIWRIDADGRNATQLTTGSGYDVNPRCTPDGRSVVFESARAGPFTPWMVSIDGGSPTQLVQSLCRNQALSPTGDRIACLSAANPKQPVWRLALTPLSGGPAVLLPEPFPIVTQIEWDKGGEALLYIDTRAAVSNVWRKTLDGRGPKRLTSFDADLVFAFDQHPVTGALACVRGLPNRNIVRVNLAQGGQP